MKGTLKLASQDKCKECQELKRQMRLIQTNIDNYNCRIEDLSDWPAALRTCWSLRARKIAKKIEECIDTMVRSRDFLRRDEERCNAALSERERQHMIAAQEKKKRKK